MTHTIRDKAKLLNRVRRLRGQLNGIERALIEEREPADILHTIAACRGAIDGLLGQVMEGHIREHVLDEHRKATPDQMRAAEDLIAVLRTYLK
ncbi:metal/formaldehyde-sensitive transcriptional repressor [Dyella sp.]|uniref:metal/formaldehyde-sensitive transcriptional repressor n=1 Tax=Dyella sp. TaxID=1869338 RepID=UPI002B5E6004|nr:metal/formaldehyde-sensitive transcriptional repressor [Rhodanobacteraceae bacterium]